MAPLLERVFFLSSVAGEGGGEGGFRKYKSYNNKTWRIDSTSKDFSFEVNNSK